MVEVTNGSIWVQRGSLPEKEDPAKAPAPEEGVRQTRARKRVRALRAFSFVQILIRLIIWSKKIIQQL